MEEVAGCGISIVVKIFGLLYFVELPESTAGLTSVGSAAFGGSVFDIG